MKRLSAALGLTFCVILAPQAHADNKLNQPYALTLGDMISVTMNQFLMFGEFRKWAPMMTLYDREAERIVIRIYGSRSTISGARESLQDVRGHLPPIFDFIENVWGIRLSESNVTLVYMDTNKNNKELIRFDGGQFVR